MTAGGAGQVCYEFASSANERIPSLTRQRGKIDGGLSQWQPPEGRGAASRRCQPRDIGDSRGQAQEEVTVGDSAESRRGPRTFEQPLANKEAALLGLSPLGAAILSLPSERGGA